MTPSAPASTARASVLYAIGDLQGCQDSLSQLLGRIRQLSVPDPDAAKFLFVGDLINRGPRSLATLRQVRELCMTGQAEAILGNHDLHLLAVAAGVRKVGKQDTLAEILDAPDCAELLEWLRHLPLALQHEIALEPASGAGPALSRFLFVHAGVLPQWTADQTLALAGEIACVLRGPDWKTFIASMYGNQPGQWHDGLAGPDRLRCIVNGLTRLRLCDSDGKMDFDVKENSAQAPAGLLPWYAVPGRRTQDVTVVFGHWSAQGLVQHHQVIGLDTGCVWGGKLTALRLTDRALVQVSCPQIHKPGK